MKPFVTGDRVGIPGGKCGILMGVVQGIAHVRLEDSDPQAVIQRIAFSNLTAPSHPPPARPQKVTVVVDGTKETESKVGATEVKEELVIEQKPAEEESPTIATPAVVYEEDEAPDAMGFLKGEPDLYTDEDGEPVMEGAAHGRLSCKEPNVSNSPKLAPQPEEYSVGAPQKITKRWLSETSVEDLQEVLETSALSKARAKKIRAAIKARTNT